MGCSQLPKVEGKSFRQFADFLPHNMRVRMCGAAIIAEHAEAHVAALGVTEHNINSLDREQATAFNMFQKVELDMVQQYNRCAQFVRGTTATGIGHIGTSESVQDAAPFDRHD